MRNLARLIDTKYIDKQHVNFSTFLTINYDHDLKYSHVY